MPFIVVHKSLVYFEFFTILICQDVIFELSLCNPLFFHFVIMNPNINVSKTNMIFFSDHEINLSQLTFFSLFYDVAKVVMLYMTIYPNILKIWK
jgi:hypothetical protein